MEDIVESWILPCIISYWFVIHFIAKGIAEKGRYRRENDRF